MDLLDRNNFDFDLSEFRVVWVHAIPFLIPNYLTIHQEKYLAASQLTLLLQNVSVDHVLKTWLKDYDKESDEKDDTVFTFLDEILEFARDQNYTLFKRLRSIKFNPETESSLACDAVFSRLQTTVKAIHFHIKFGYYYESFTLIRLLFEQLAYAYTASMVAEGKLTKFISPTKSVLFLRELIPKSGKMYGALSKLSHLDTSTISKYLVIDEGMPKTVHHSVYFSLEAAFYYLEVLEYQSIVFEYSFRDYLQEFQSIEINNEGKYIFKKNLDSQNVKNKYQNKILKVLKEKG